MSCRHPRERIASASVVSKDYSRSYMIEIQRSMNSKEPLSDGVSHHIQAMNGVNRGPLKLLWSFFIEDCSIPGSMSSWMLLHWLPSN